MVDDVVIKADFRPQDEHPDPDMIRVLKEILDKARAGEIDAVMLSFSGGEESGRRAIIRDHAEFMRTLGEMHTLMTTMTMDVHLEQAQESE